MKALIRQVLLGLMAITILYTGWQPHSAQAVDNPDNTAVHLTGIQIRQQLSAREAERNSRLDLRPENPVLKMIADPQIWLIGLATTLAMSSIGILFLLWMMRRLKNRNWQPAINGDWQSGRSRPAAKVKHRPIAAVHGALAKPAPAPLRRPPLQNQDNAWNAIEYVPAPLPACAKIVKTANAPMAGPPHAQVIFSAVAAPASAAPDAVRPEAEAEPAAQPVLSEAEEALFDLRSVQVAAIEVSENIPPLEQARYWADFRKPELAIEILEQTCGRDDIPNNWVMLFDLYRQTGQQAEYEALRLEFKEIYNAKVPCWRDATATQPGKSLKDMPDLVQRINKMLPSNGVIDYLRDFLFDDRGGQREGFELGVYRDLLTLFNRVASGQPVPGCEVLWHR